MQYAFVLGRVYTLSLAELLAVLENKDLNLLPKDEPIKIIEASLEVAIVETASPLPVEKIQRRLGGTIKILQVVDVVKKREKDSVNFALKHYFKPSVLKKQFFKDYKGKMQFGLSIYLLDMDVQAFGEPKRIGMMIKNSLTESGQSVRLVLPEFNSLALASVVVTKNLLLQKGAEICILAGKTHVYTAKTCTVQDFEDYGRRDYQRPVRDEKQGMIPPKVAQVMLNLACCKPNSTILDPFCGIGTILQEGILLGYKMLGSDISKNAIAGSEKNLEWFRNRYKIAPGKYSLEISDARNMAHLLQEQKISAVVTESTLGPIYATYPTADEIKKNFLDLEDLYRQTFKEYAKFLPPQGRVVMCIPAYRKNKDQYEMFGSIDFIEGLGYNHIDTISPHLSKKFKFLKVTERGTAIYDRKDQIVAREIVVFEKQ